MPEVRPLSDYFNPMQTGLQILQLQAQQQNADTHAAALAQSQKAQDESSLMQLYKEAPPMQRYPIYRKLMENRGFAGAVVPPDKFYANPDIYDTISTADPGTPEYKEAYSKWLEADPASREEVRKESERRYALRGANALVKAANLPPGTEQLLVQSPAVQSQATNVVAKTGLEQEKEKALVQKRQETERITANVNTQLQSLIPMQSSTKLFLERTGPVMDAMERLDNEYETKAAQIGPTKAGELRDARKRMNPDIAKFEEARQQRIPELEDQVKQVEQQRMQLETRMNLIAAGADAPKDGESLSTLQAQVEASSYALAAQRAQLAYAKNPTRENHMAMQSAKENMDIHIEDLNRTKSLAQENLDLKQGMFDEKVAEYKAKQDLEQRISSAQQDLAQIGKDATPQQQSAIARKYRVKVSDITPAIKDPNNPLNNININTEKKYGEAFAQKVAGRDDEMLDAARKAPDIIERAARVQDILSNSKTITGIGADFRLQFAKAMKLSGLYESDDIANTETLAADLASTTLDAIKASGLGSGTGFSNADRDFLEKARGGRITFEKDTILRLSRLAQRAGEKSIERWNARVKEIPDDALSGTGISKKPLPIPSGPKAGTIEDGYRFKGGNPSDPRNWEKQ